MRLISWEDFFAKIWMIGTWCLDLLFPRFCIGCRREETWWCEVCRGACVVHPNEPALVAGEEGWMRVFAGYDYGDVQIEKAVHALKYQGVHDLGVIMGAMLADRVREVGFLGGGVEGREDREDGDTGREAWCVMAVPLHPDKYKSRGYNQAEVIGRSFSDALGLEYIEEGLVRTRATPSQTTLGRVARLENVAGVFAVREDVEVCAARRRVLLVDDVCTTGATLGECGGVLRKAGCEEVCAVVVAHHLTARVVD